METDYGTGIGGWVKLSRPAICLNQSGIRRVDYIIIHARFQKSGQLLNRKVQRLWPIEGSGLPTGSGFELG
jgi:hypothetical protein